MLKKMLIAAIAVAASTPAFAGGGIGFSATDPEGTIERIVERRTLPNGMTGAIASYTRKDGTRSFVEYAFSCDPLSYAYLGMDHDDGNRTPNMKVIRDASDQLLTNELRPVQPIQLDPTSPEAPIRAMAQAVCS